MLFISVYVVSVALLAALSATPLVENRRIWWQAAWTLAGISFAVCQFHLYLGWIADRMGRPEEEELILTLVTPVTVLLIAGLTYRTTNPLLRALRVLICLGLGYVGSMLWLGVLLVAACVFSMECL